VSDVPARPRGPIRWQRNACADSERGYGRCIGVITLGSMTDLRSRAAAPASRTLDDPIYDRLLKERIVFLGTEVNDEVANRICGQLLLLAADDPERDISLWINSPGGVVYAGLAIYDTMNFINNDVVTVAMGVAGSMGQMLLCAGTAGKRYALPHARIVMHQPSGGIGGTAADIAIQAEQMLYTKQMLLELIAQHTGQPYERIVADADRDRWFTAEEARRYGFIDKVISTAAAVA
jgi:ATP-dependent Clp protease, protease subunit